MIDVACQSCGHSYPAEDHKSGFRTPCPSCGTPNRVPAIPDVPSVPPSPSPSPIPPSPIAPTAPRRRSWLPIVLIALAATLGWLAFRNDRRARQADAERQAVVDRIEADRVAAEGRYRSDADARRRAESSRRDSEDREREREQEERRTIAPKVLEFAEKQFAKGQGGTIVDSRRLDEAGSWAFLIRSKPYEGMASGDRQTLGRDHYTVVVKQGVIVPELLDEDRFWWLTMTPAEIAQKYMLMFHHDESYDIDDVRVVAPGSLDATVSESQTGRRWKLTVRDYGRELDPID